MRKYGESLSFTPNQPAGGQFQAQLSQNLTAVSSTDRTVDTTSIDTVLHNQLCKLRDTPGARVPYVIRLNHTAFLLIKKKSSAKRFVFMVTCNE